MHIYIAYRTGTTEEIKDVNLLEIGIDKKGNKTIHWSYMDTESRIVNLGDIDDIRISDTPLASPALYHYLDQVDNVELSARLRYESLTNAVCGWNYRNGTSLNPSDAIDSYLKWAEMR